MGLQIADFVAKLKIDGDTFTLKSMINYMADMKLETLGEIAALGGLGLAFKNAAKEAMQLSKNYMELNKNFDINTSMVQRWQNVARSIASVTVTPEGVQQSFQNLAQLLAGPLAGDPSSKFFQAASRLGLGNVQGMKAENVEELMRAKIPVFMQEMTRRFGAQQATNLTNRLLGDMGQVMGMQSLFTLSGRQFARGENSSHILTPDQIRNWAQLSKNIDTVTHNLLMMAQEIMSTAVPEILKWTNALIDSEGWIKKRFGQASDVASLPWKDNMPFGGTLDHVIASLFIPDRVRQESKQLGNVNQTNKTDIHINGGDAHAIGEIAKKHQERIHQQQLNQAQALISDMQFW